MQLSDVLVDAQLFSQNGAADPGRLNGLLPAPIAEEAFSEISAWPEYAPTPIRDLSPLAQAAGIGALLYKDESQRLGLGGVQALGGAYSVLRLSAEILAQEIGSRPALSSIRNGAYIDALRNVTVAVASDDPLGISVAWGARLAGCRCKVFVPATAPSKLLEQIAEFGAEAIRIDGDDVAARQACAAAASTQGWHLAADGPNESGKARLQDVLAGYSVVASEALDFAAGPRPTHVFVEARTAELAVASSARYRHVLGNNSPRLILVRSRSEDRQEIAWTIPSDVRDILPHTAAASLTVDDRAVRPILARLHENLHETDAIAFIGLLGALGAAASPALREILGITQESCILTSGNESLADELNVSDEDLGWFKESEGTEA